MGGGDGRGYGKVGSSNDAENAIPYRHERIILFVRRKGTRRLLNSLDLQEIARNRIAKIAALEEKDGGKGGSTFVVKGSIFLEEMTFTQQLLLFQSTAILIAVHGQGCTNTLFMKGEGQSALLMVMPYDFFGWHYVYANAAVSLGVHAIVMMRPDDHPTGGWQGGVDNDRVNARRDENFKLREDIFEDGLEIALARVQGSGSGGEWKGGFVEERVVDVEYVRGAEMLEF